MELLAVVRGRETVCGRTGRTPARRQIQIGQSSSSADPSSSPSPLFSCSLLHPPMSSPSAKPPFTDPLPDAAHDRKFEHQQAAQAAVEWGLQHEYQIKELEVGRPRLYSTSALIMFHLVTHRRSLPTISLIHVPSTILSWKPLPASTFVLLFCIHSHSRLTLRNHQGNTQRVNRALTRHIPHIHSELRSALDRLTELEARFPRVREQVIAIRRAYDQGRDKVRLLPPALHVCC